MRILWVKAGGLVPADVGGRIRSYRILRELAKNHQVTLFTFYAAQENDEHPALTEVFENVICWPLSLPKPRSAAESVNFVRHLFSRWPYSVSKYCRPEVARGMRELLQREQFDVIVCDFAIAAGVIPWEIPTPKVLFTHNVEAQIWERHVQVASNPVWKAVTWGECKKMLAFERACLQRAQHVLTVSEVDRDFFSQFVARERITAIPTGVDTEYFQPDSRTPTANQLVFTGSMDWMPNEDAMVYFIRDILPLVRKAIPGARLAVVGRAPSQRLHDVARAADVHVTGRVEDIRPYVAQAAVYVVPLRIGGGTRLKIFEAMAMGKAIISTTIGAEGLPVTNGQDIVIADGADAFADTVVTLLQAPEEQRRLGTAARQLVESKYGWSSVASVFEDVLQRVTRGEATAPAPASSRHAEEAPASNRQ